MRKIYRMILLALAACFLGFILLRARNQSKEGVLNYQLISSPNGNWSLEKDLNESELRVVPLDLTPEDCIINSLGRGIPCPEMSPCRGDLIKLSYCAVDSFFDPKAGVVQTLQHQAGGQNRTVTLGYPAFEGRLFQIDDIFVDHKGNIFDDKLAFHHGGCQGKKYFFNYRAGSEVALFSEGVNLVHTLSHNYYHFMGEMLPGMFQARQFIVQNPQIPLIVQAGASIERVLRILRLENLTKVIFIKKPGIIHLNRTYVPTKPNCFKASNAVWRNFRDFYFARSVPEILGEQKPRVVEHLKIVVAKRTQSRRINDFDILIEKLRIRIKGEVVIFTGDEGLEGTMEIFSDATIYVGPHGAGLANMMFMPDNGIVLEILPDDHLIYCFGHMAAAIGLEYHMILGVGNRATPLVVDLDKVVDRVAELAARFRPKSQNDKK